MGLLDKFPNLDDKTFEDLVKEARSLIPHYAPEWTDHNFTDPGITFIELFAWLAEMQIYQLNRVTDINYRKFLKLAGLYPYDASPAKVGIISESINEIEAGMQVFTKLDTENIIFEIEEDINLIKGNLRSVITLNDSRKIDNTEANKKGIFFKAFGENPKEGDELQLEFDTSIPDKDFQITFLLHEENLTIAEIRSKIIPSVNLEWEYFIDEKWNAFNIKEDTTQAFTGSGKIILSLPQNGRNKKIYRIRCRIAQGNFELPPLVESIKLNIVTAIQIETIKNEDMGKSSGFPDQNVFFKKKPVLRTDNLYGSRFVMGNVLDWPGLLKMFKEEAQSENSDPGKWIWSFFNQDIQNLIMGWKDDQKPDPEFKYAIVTELNNLLENRDLYDADIFRDVKLPTRLKDLTEYKSTISDAQLNSLNMFLIKSEYPDKITDGNPVIQVQGIDSRWETWIETDNFEYSCPDDPHYILDPETGGITFGNGQNGLIPLRDRNIRALIYKTTMGQKGNFPSGQKFWLYDLGSRRYFGENPNEASGGTVAESLEHAKARAKMDFRSITRAITSDDFEKMTYSTPGIKVARARAIPGHDPDYPCIDVPGSVTVVVVPSGNGEKPMPGKGFLQTISNHLDVLRLITTNLQVSGPEYIKISVMCKVTPMKRSSPAEVEKRVQDALKVFLHPLIGGHDKKGWPFGRAVYPSDIYQIIEKVEGVDYATNVNLSAQSDNLLHRKIGETIVIPSTALVYSGDHKVITADSQITYVRISVKCEVTIEENSNPGYVKRYILRDLENFLNPHKGGSEGKGWPQGHPVYPAEIKKIIGKAQGVKHIENIFICQEGRQYQNETLKIPTTGFAVSGEHIIKILEQRI